MANKKEIQSATFPDCPVRNVISRITDKWSLLVLYTLEHQEVMRFNDLWRQIPDISQKNAHYNTTPSGGLESSTGWI